MQYFRMPNFDWRERNHAFAFAWANFWAVVARVNPDYAWKYTKIATWLFEYSDEGRIRREVGLSKTGDVVVAGPDKRNMGMLVGTNLYVEFFEQCEKAGVDCRISEAEFVSAWERSGRVYRWDDYPFRID